jgi:cell wall-associated NlpC family hydrolase
MAKQGQVILPIAVAGVTVTIADIRESGTWPRPGRFIALAALAIGLTALGEVESKMASSLAWLVAIGVVLSRGNEAIKGVSKGFEATAIGPAQSLAITTMDLTRGGTTTGRPALGNPGIPLPGGGTLGGGGGAGDVAVEFARQQLGEPYLWGATGPDKWDCSGLVQASWKAAGVNIPRVTFAQALTGKRVPNLASCIPGDLVFPPEATKYGHVVMATTNGCTYAIQAPHTGDVVRENPYTGGAIMIRRPGA